jgi:hypothetical protein
VYKACIGLQESLQDGLRLRAVHVRRRMRRLGRERDYLLAQVVLSAGSQGLASARLFVHNSRLPAAFGEFSDV